MWKDLYIYFNHWLKANDKSKNSTILNCNGILIWSPANPIFQKPSHLICTLITEFHAKFTWKITILIKIFAASDEYSLPLMVYVCWRYGLDNIMANDYYSVLLTSIKTLEDITMTSHEQCSLDTQNNFFQLKLHLIKVWLKKQNPNNTFFYGMNNFMVSFEFH